MILEHINSLIEESKNINHKLGLCLRLSLKTIKDNRNLKLYQGPPGRVGDSSHFWLVGENGKIIDPAKKEDHNVVPDSYPYVGRKVNPDSILKELGITWNDIN